jgi:anti-anti-sigma factor
MTQTTLIARTELCELEVADLRPTPLLRMCGEVDVSSVTKLADALERLAGNARNIVVDMTDVVLIDSTVLGALVLAQKRLRGGGGDLFVAGATAEVRRVFEVTGLHRSLRLVDGVPHALDALETAGGRAPASM